jgi:hypothetical protein
MKSGKRRLATDALTEDHRAGDLNAAQNTASHRHTTRAIPDEAFRNWLTERLDQPHLYDIETELLQARWVS